MTESREPMPTAPGLTYSLLCLRCHQGRVGHGVFCRCVEGSAACAPLPEEYEAEDEEVPE
jgi:hypothetical protein